MRFPAGKKAFRTNRLIAEKSPYLLQHAENPVDWYPWGDEPFKIAAETDRPVIISIGYASCHWCHVMAHESFENEMIAEIMNERFICIKVDREERPDVDMHFMQAVQLISGSGGWPLNTFTIPDGHPFFGGTYFRRDAWGKLLISISDYYRNDRSRILKTAEFVFQKISDRVETTVSDQTEKHMQLLGKQDSASKKSGSMNPSLIGLFPYGKQEDDSAETLKKIDAAVLQLSNQFDRKHGGIGSAPKFPIPTLLQFLLSYGSLRKKDDITAYVRLTLEKMAERGLYDQLGGGFFRYSTDDLWMVPHYEKMLYDNAQLVSIFSDAFLATGYALFRLIAEETITFLNDTFAGPDGCFYSSLDADSEGKEGNYYLWSESELRKVLGNDYSIVQKHLYRIRDGLFGEEQIILLRLPDSLPLSLVERVRKTLTSHRSSRNPPSLDDKVLVSWNALTARAFYKAYSAFRDESYCSAAEKIINVLLSKYRKPDGSLLHIGKDNIAYIDGYLEDYAFLMSALIDSFCITGNSSRLETARELADYILDHFWDASRGACFVSSKPDPRLSRGIDDTDSVIPSSNAITAESWLKLSRLTSISAYRDAARIMIDAMQSKVFKNIQFYSRWAELLLLEAVSEKEVVIIGKLAANQAANLRQMFAPDVTTIFSEVQRDDMLLFRNRFSPDALQIFICTGTECLHPIYTYDQAVDLLQSRLQSDSQRSSE